MRYYIDTEFYEDGRELYHENSEFDWSMVPKDHWIQSNVRPFLEHGDGVRCSFTRAELRFAIQQFVFNGHGKPVFYGYYADYDWVVFCQLFGRMVDLPEGFPYYCRDLKQTMEELGLDGDWKKANCPDPVNEHHALVDARWNMDLHKAILAVR